MGSRLICLLPLLALALAGCGDHIAPAEGLEAKLKDANARANDGTTVPRAHSLRTAADRAPKA